MTRALAVMTLMLAANPGAVAEERDPTLRVVVRLAQGARAVPGTRVDLALVRGPERRTATLTVR